MDKQERNYYGLVFFWAFMGVAIYLGIGKLVQDLPPGWDEILQGSFGFLWLIGGGIFVSKKYKALQKRK